MRLNKFLRKNSRTLILVFMSLLLVAFLVPQTIQGIGQARQGAKAEVGKAYGRAVTTEDLERLRNEWRVISGLSPFDQSLPTEELINLYLLWEEAERAGIRVGREEVKKWLGERRVPDATLQRIQQRTSYRYNRIYDVIGKWLAANRLAALQARGVCTSLPRQEIAYRDTTQKADVRISAINTRAFVHMVPEPTEEELQAFFEECKGRVSEHTEQGFQFGYRDPDRVQIEYLTVNPEKIKRSITITGLQVKHFFEDHPQRYQKPDPSASKPTGGRPPMVPMTFEEAEKLAREDCRAQRAIETAQELINDIHAEAHRPWATTVREEDGFSKTPEGELVSFEALRDKYSTKYEVEYGQTELLSAPNLRYAPGIGMSGFALESGQAARVFDLAFRVKGIIEEDPKDGLPIYNVGEPADVVFKLGRSWQSRIWITGQPYVYRVITIAPSAPPESLEPLREDLIRDWKLVQAHKLAGEQAERLAERAGEIGLEAAAQEATELRAILAAGARAATQPAVGTAAPAMPPYVQHLEPTSPADFKRTTTQIRPVGPISEDIARDIFALADVPPSETTPAHRVQAIPVTNQIMWIVAELVDVDPVYAGPFEKQLVETSRSSMLGDQGTFQDEWSSQDNIHARAGFTLRPAPEESTAP